MSGRSGQCLCGAVRFTARALGGFGACHCPQCLRWLGGPMLGVTVAEADMAIEGDEHVGAYRSSDWATRYHCTRCGGALWYRYDRGEDGAGDYEVPIGLLDDANGLELAREIFIDAKPDCYALAGERPRLTRAEVMAVYGSAGNG